MKFGELKIGDLFIVVRPFGGGTYEAFEKKSNSSTYLLKTDRDANLQRSSVRRMTRAVRVYKLVA